MARYNDIEGRLNNLWAELNDGIESWTDKDYSDYLAECMYWHSVELMINKE